MMTKPLFEEELRQLFEDNTSIADAYRINCDQLRARGVTVMPTKAEFVSTLAASGKNPYANPENRLTIYKRYAREMELGGEEPLDRDAYLEYLKVVAISYGLKHPIKEVRAYVKDFPVEFLKQVTLYRRQKNFKLLAEMLQVTVQQLGTIVKDLYGFTAKELEGYVHFSALTRKPICGDVHVVCVHDWVRKELERDLPEINFLSEVFVVRDATYLHLLEIRDNETVGHALKLSRYDWTNDIRMAADVVPETMIFNVLGVVETYIEPV